MSKYDVLVRVLDRLSAEAPPEFKSYHPEASDVEGVNTSRFRAYIHLFLKVRFGLLTFAEREVSITEGANDDGIDAYFIDVESRSIFFVQSKFRQTERNFLGKTIELEELLRMDAEPLTVHAELFTQFILRALPHFLLVRMDRESQLWSTRC